MNKIHISPAEFVSMTYDIFLQIKVDKQNFKSVVSIANGGIPLGEKLSEMLHLPYTSLKISTYDEANFKVYCSPIVEGDAPSDYFLLVDDIVDSGHTIKYLSEKLEILQGKNFKLASLHWVKENENHVRPDYFANTKEKGDWITYYWEEKKTV